QIEGHLVRFAKYRRESGLENGENACDVRIGWHDNLIFFLQFTKLDPRTENQRERIQTISGSHAVFCSAIGGKFALKGLVVLPVNKPSAFERLSKNLGKPNFVSGVEFLKIEKFY